MPGGFYSPSLVYPPSDIFKSRFKSSSDIIADTSTESCPKPAMKWNLPLILHWELQTRWWYFGNSGRTRGINKHRFICTKTKFREVNQLLLLGGNWFSYSLCCKNFPTLFPHHHHLFVNVSTGMVGWMAVPGIVDQWPLTTTVGRRRCDAGSSKSPRRKHAFNRTDPNTIAYG